MSRVFMIAWHEYHHTVRRKEFVLLTLGLPVLILVLGGVSAVGSIMAASALRTSQPRAVGVVDRSGALRFQPHGVQATPVRVYTDEEAGRLDVRRGVIAALVVVGPEYIATGDVSVYRKGGGILTAGEGPALGPLLTRAVLSARSTDERLVRRAVEPTGPRGARAYVIDRDGRFVPRSVAREAARFVVPYAFTILLTMSIFFSASYLLRGVAEEKENRVIEVVLSSVTASELLSGKLVGLGAVGLTQVGVWLAFGAAPALTRFGDVVTVTPAAVAWVALFFILGYALYATLMTGVGALGTNYRESQQITGAISFAAFIPFLFIPILVEFPNGALARTFSYIPFTAPTTMVLRLTAADVPPVDIALAALSLVAATWLFLRLAARLFRFGLLIYGKRPGWRETLRVLRQAS
ncbi:MAG TPA: ABC transporter permease [Chthonomonadales bacterium]|nr:ABC transporter permease [Chthonomonadales bacterium]